MQQLEVYNPNWKPAHTLRDDQVHLYMVECLDGYPYIGTTMEPWKRLDDHWIHEGSQKCREHTPARVGFVTPGTSMRVYAEVVENEVQALALWLRRNRQPGPYPIVRWLYRQAYKEQRIVPINWLGEEDTFDAIYKRVREATDEHTPARPRRGPAEPYLG